MQEQIIRQSILDRLIDNDPLQSREKPPTGQQLVEQLRESVRTNLEQLFNTRIRVLSPGTHLPELKQSLSNYGLEDLCSLNLMDNKRCKEFCSDLEKSIRHYEPRIRNIKVTTRKANKADAREICFRLSAVLCADPTGNQIVFDSLLEPVTRAMNIKEGSHD